MGHCTHGEHEAEISRLLKKVAALEEQIANIGACVGVTTASPSPPGERSVLVAVHAASTQAAAWDAYVDGLGVCGEFGCALVATCEVRHKRDSIRAPVSTIDPKQVHIEYLEKDNRFLSDEAHKIAYELAAERARRECLMRAVEDYLTDGGRTTTVGGSGYVCGACGFKWPERSAYDELILENAHLRSALNEIRKHPRIEAIENIALAALDPSFKRDAT